MGIRHLVVVDNDHHPTGMITRQELHTDFRADLN